VRRDLDEQMRELVERRAEDPRDVHLGVTELGRDLGLRESASEAKEQDPLLPLVEALDACAKSGPILRAFVLFVLPAELLEKVAVDSRISGHYRLDAVRGHLLERAGRTGEAIAYLRAASERTASIPERDYLVTKAARLRERAGHNGDA